MSAHENGPLCEGATCFYDLIQAQIPVYIHTLHHLPGHTSLEDSMSAHVNGLLLFWSGPPSVTVRPVSLISFSDS